jgi:hypothetical protein
MNEKMYAAPWGISLRIISFLCAGLGVFLNVLPFLAPHKSRPPLELSGLAMLAVLLGALLFVVRGYTIGLNAIGIRRLLWTTRVPLAGIKTAEFIPGAMSRSLRLFGNGGMFSITGLYRNRRLGNYRAFVTDLKQTVVLRFEKKTIVVSPENPEQFAADIVHRISCIS